MLIGDPAGTIAAGEPWSNFRYVHYQAILSVPPGTDHHFRLVDPDRLGVFIFLHVKTFLCFPFWKPIVTGGW